MSPGEAFLKVARERPDQPAVLGEDTEWTYAQLEALVTAFALHLQRRGVRQNSTVAVRTDDLLVVIASLFACALLGAKWITASGQLASRAAIDVTHWLQSAEIAEQIHPSAIRVDPGWAQRPADFPAGMEPSFPGFDTPASPWILARTSGTTGAAKYIELAADAMIARAEAMGQMAYRPGETRFTCLFPVQAFPFLIRMIATLLNGATLVHSYNPMFWGSAGVTLVMGSPAQVWRIFENIGLRRKLPSLHVGGDKTTDAQATALLENFEEVVDVYGSTEANQVYWNVRRLDEAGQMTSRGHVLPDARIEIVSDDHQPLPPGSEGLVRVRTPYMAAGYVGNPEAQARAFRDGWFYPGDVGRMNAQAELEILGRENDQINVGGVKLNALTIDGVLMRVEGVRDAICFSIPRDNNIAELVAFLSLTPGASRDACMRKARDLCDRTLGPSAVPSVFQFLDTLPRNANGKPDRTTCAMMALAARNRLA